MKQLIKGRKLVMVIVFMIIYLTTQGQTMFYNQNIISDSVYGNALKSNQTTLSVVKSYIPSGVFESNIGVSWRSSISDRIIKQSNGRAVLRLLEPKTGFDMDSFSAQVSLSVSCLKFNPLSDATTTTNNITTQSVILSVSYNKKTGISYTELNTLKLDWVHALKLSNITISDPRLASVLNLELEIEQEVYETFNQTPLNSKLTIDNSNLSFSASMDKIVLAFPGFEGATEYDIEWRYVDRYDVLGTGLQNYEPKQDDFRFDASRVTVKSCSYTLNNVFEAGDIIFRVRPVGYTLNDLGEKMRVEFAWSNIARITNDFNGSENGHQRAVNWQYIAEFAEDGKRKEVVRYYDGSLRERQTVTQTFGVGLFGETQQTTIVQEKIYDFTGRPAIEVLPVPVDENILKYYRNMSKNTSEQKYSKSDFDIDVTTCSPATNPMSFSVGASNYYSTSSLFKNDGNYTNLNNYTPNADGFPFVQKVYTADNTGRLAAQSSPGLNHKIGSGHETRYFYLRPHQVELDRLFGTEIGNAEHYQKQVVVDANNQFSISYINPSGKVVATALSGQKPANVSDIYGYTDGSYKEESVLKTELITSKESNRIEGSSLIHEFTFVVTAPTTYKFYYSAKPETYQAQLCSSIGFCMDCVYDLSLSLVDECGNEQFNGGVSASKGPHTKTIGSSPTNSNVKTCENTGVEEKLFDNDGFVSVNLTTGSYTLRKELKLNSNALNVYKQKAFSELLTNPACSTITEFKNRASDFLSTEGCELTCEECLANLNLTSNSSTTEKETAKQQFINNYSGTQTPTSTQIEEATSAFNSMVQSCESICNPTKLNVCATYLDLLKADVRPGGQYAKFKMVDGVYLADDEFDHDNDANTASLVDYYNVLSERSDGLKTFKAGTDNFNLQTLVINGIEKTVGELTTNEFVRNFKEDWTDILVKRHPEYCYYLKCSTENNIVDFEANMLNKNTYEDAVEAGLFPDSHTITSIAELISNDPVFNLSGSSCAISSVEMNNRENTYIEQYQYLRDNGVDVEVTVSVSSAGINEVRDKKNGRLLGSLSSISHNQQLIKQANTFSSSTNLFYTIIIDPKTSLQIGKLRIAGAARYQYKMTDVPLMSLYCGHLSPNDSRAMYKCVNQARVNIKSDDYTCDDVKDLYWKNLRALYLANRNFLKQKNQNSSCGCGEVDAMYIFDKTADAFLKKEKRFYPTSPNGNSIYKNTNGVWLDPQQESKVMFEKPSNLLTSFLDDVSDNVSEQCQKTCDGYKMYWREQLEMCDNLSPSQINAILADLSSVCQRGCDINNPLGASTISPNATGSIKSFKDVLVNHNIYDPGVCDDILFSMPKPYNHDYMAYLKPYSDTCGCDENKYNYFIDGDVKCELNTANVEPQNCNCNTNTNLTNETKLIVQLSNPVEEERKCKTCIGCAQIAPHFNTFSTLYSTISDSDPKYKELLTNYMNNKLNMNLLFKDYYNLLTACNQEHTINGFKQKFVNVGLAKNDDVFPNNKLDNLENQYLVSTPTPVVIKSVIADKQELEVINPNRFYGFYKNEIDDVLVNTLTATASTQLQTALSPQLNKSIKLQNYFKDINSGTSAINRVQSTTPSTADKCGCDKIFSIIKNNPTYSDEQIEQAFAETYNNGEKIPKFKELKELCCLSANSKKLTKPGTGDDMPGGQYDNGDDLLEDVPPTQPGKLPGKSGDLGEPCQLPDLKNFAWGDEALSTLSFNFAQSGIKFPETMRCGEVNYKIDACGCEQLAQYQSDYQSLAGSTSQTFEEYVKASMGVTTPIPNLLAILEICSSSKGTGDWTPEKVQILTEKFYISGYSLPKEFGCAKRSNNPGDPGGPRIPGTGLPGGNPVFCDLNLSCEYLMNNVLSNFPGQSRIYINEYSFDKMKSSAAWANVRAWFLAEFANLSDNCAWRIILSKNLPKCGSGNAVDYFYGSRSELNINVDYWIEFLLLYSCGCEPINGWVNPRPVNKVACENCYAPTAALKSIEQYLNKLAGNNPSTPPDETTFNHFFQPLEAKLSENPPLKELGDYIFQNSTGGLMTYTAQRITDLSYMLNYYKVELTATNSEGANITRYITLDFTTDHPGNLFCFIRQVFDIKLICGSDPNSFEAKVKLELYDPNRVSVNDRFVIRTIRGTISGDDLPSIKIEYPCCVKVCNRPFNYAKPIEDPCVTQINLEVEANAKLSYNTYLQQTLANIENEYVKKCLNSITESLVVKYSPADYHYTLYYYDVAGNLLKTVPPQGVKILNATSLGNVPTRRLELGNGQSTTPIVPAHELTTVYRYNTLNQLIWQSTPDAGESNFYYDDLGRIVFSQNAQQKQINTKLYSYTKYDALGRIVEVGQVQGGAVINHAMARQPATVNSYITNGTRTQITRTFYDEAQLDDDLILEQKNLFYRVAKTTYQDVENTLTTNNVKHAVLYSYDIHGNVNTLARQNVALTQNGFEQDVKTIEYDYDLISGKVNWVMYQRNQPDQFIHQYKYDGDNRLVDVFTGTRPELLKNDARYFYYLHGPLARTELGDHLSQGVDYTYTINGWLKAVNGVSLTPTRDMGRDGDASVTSNIHKYFASDEFGFELNYFNSDYSSVSTQNNVANFISTKTGSVIEQANKGLYNGNISNMITAIARFTQNGAAPLASLYQYDQLNRIKTATYYNNFTKATNTWNTTGSSLLDYYNEFSYDANGNIMTQKRNGSQVMGVVMDNLTYNYKTGTNQLTSVMDAIGNTSYNDDIDNQQNDNYSYDKIGNLTKDIAEEIAEIKWNVYGKITAITRTAGSTKPDLEFEYTPDGHRAVKIVKPKTGPTEYTYYVRDAQGNIMATYSRKMEKVIDYGSITFSDLNTRLLNQVGATAFGNFIGNVHLTKVNNSGFNNAVHSAFTSLATVGTLLEGLSVLPLLEVDPSPYRNWLLTSLPPNPLLENYYFSGAEMSGVYGRQRIVDLCNCDMGEFFKTIASNPKYAFIFVKGVCNYDRIMRTQLANKFKDDISSAIICPADDDVRNWMYENMSTTNDYGYQNMIKFAQYLNNNFDHDCEKVAEILDYAYDEIEASNDADMLQTYYSLLSNIPSYNINTRINNYCNCGGFDMTDLIQNRSVFLSFIQALNVLDNAKYTQMCAYLSIPSEISKFDEATSSMPPSTLEDGLNNIGLSSCNLLFKQVMQTLGYTNISDFNALFQDYTIVPQVNLTCTNYQQAYSCTGQGSPINTLITQYYSQAELWSTLLLAADASHYTQWYYINQLPVYLPLAAANTLTQVSSYQQSHSSMYGSTTDAAMANYMQYIHEYFGNTVYNQLTNHYLNISRMYDDSIKASEFMLYGSSRLGAMRADMVMAAARFNNPEGTQTFTNTNTIVATYSNTFAFNRGLKQFELSNHLGNVLAVVTDKKIQDVAYLNYFDAHIDLWTNNGVTPTATVAFDLSGTGNTELRQAKITTTQNGGGGLKEIQTIPGTEYKFTFTVNMGTAPGITAKVRAKNGSTPYNGTVLAAQSVSSSATYTISFTANTTTTQLVFEKTGGQGTSQSFYIDKAMVFAATINITAPERLYRAEVLHANDYSPFGAPMPSRSYSYNKRDAVVVSQLAGSMSTTGWQTTYCTAPTSCTTPESSVTLSITAEGKLRMQATKRYSQMYYTFTTVPGRVYRVKYKLSNSDMLMVNTSVFAPVAKKELYTTANITTFTTEREMVFTATETTTRFYVTKGWSAAATTASQQVHLDYLLVVELPSQVNYITCASINENLTMLANAGVNTNDSVQVRNTLNIYYNRSYSYAAYNQVLSSCANNTLTYVLAQPGAEAEEYGYRFGFNSMETENSSQYSDEIFYSTEFRMLNASIGRWFSVDPLGDKYSGFSPYNFALNSPLTLNDIDGDDPVKDQNDNSNSKNEVSEVEAPKPPCPNLEGKKEGLFSKLMNFLKSIPIWQEKTTFKVIPLESVSVEGGRGSNGNDWSKTHALKKGVTYNIKYNMRGMPDEMDVYDQNDNLIASTYGPVSGRGTLSVPAGVTKIKVVVKANLNSATSYRYTLKTQQNVLVKTRSIWFLGIIPVKNKEYKYLLRLDDNREHLSYSNWTNIYRGGRW